MAIEKMKLVKVSGPLTELDRFLSSCCIDGNFQPEQPTQYMSASLGYTSLNEENPYAPMLQKIEDLIRENDSAPDPSLVEIGRENLVPDEETKEYIDRLDTKLSKIHAQKKALEEQLKTCQNGIDQFSHFVGYNVSFEEIFSCEFIKTRFGHMPIESYDKLVSYNDNPYILFFPCSKDETDYWGAYSAPRERIDMVDSVFASLCFERLHVPEAVGTATEIIDELKNNIKIIESDIKALDEEAAKIWNENRAMCNEIYTRLYDLNAVFDLRHYAMSHNSYFFYVGWVPKRNVNDFVEKAKTIKNVEVEVTVPDKRSKNSTPVKLRNLKLFKPFEFFVDMYGLPSYQDVDVTSFVAITYTLLFGIMFGDLGQGAVLVILGILGWKLKKMALARIIIPCGLCSMVFGFIFGSVFGYEHMLDPVYHALGWAGKPLSVMESINTVLLVAIGIGVTLVVMAMILNMYACIKHNKIGEAIFSQNGLVGIFIYAAGVTFCVSFMTGKKILPNAVIFSVIGVCAVLLFLKEIIIGKIDKHDNWKPESAMDFVLQNIFELIEYILSYFSNTVSFLRVGAFVIVHASMMMVVFTLGNGGKNIPVVIIGNIIVIALEGLLTGIQGLRLEFYEMFSRFYEGSGHAFKPVKLSTSHEASGIEKIKAKRAKKVKKAQKA